MFWGIMKEDWGCFLIVLLLLPNAGFGKDKEDKIDPRLKQIHTIFLKGSVDAIHDLLDQREKIEKGSCLKLADNAESADAILRVSYVPGGVSEEPAGQARVPGMDIQVVRRYHTAFEISIREGPKMKKIWDKHVDLNRGEQDSQPGALRLMDFLSHDACDGR
jgi:hypothetical protein